MVAWRRRRRREGRGEDGKPLLKCSKWPWVSIAPGCFERAVRKERRSTPPPPIPPAPGRETTLPRMGGNYENSQWFRSLSAHENTQRGESAYGLPLVFDGLLPRSNAFLPPRRYGFFLFLSNLVQLNLTLFFFFFFWFEFFLFVWFLIDYLFHVVFFFLSIFDIIRGWKKGNIVSINYIRYSLK